MSDLLLSNRSALPDNLASEIATGLHDLCQPLSTLQCRLEIGMMDATATAMSAAIAEALHVCVQLNDQVRGMQIRVLQSRAAREGEGI